MADNVAVTAGSGTTIATDDVAGVHYQRVKLVNGTLDATDAIGGDATNGLDVDVTRLPALPAGTNNIGDVDVLSVPAPLSTTGNGTAATALRVTLASDSTGSHAVTNAGTFATQVDGAALTALQLIDDPVFADDAAFTPATSKVMAAGFTADDSSTDLVDEGDIGIARMTVDRKQIVVLGEAAANLVRSGGAKTDTTDQELMSATASTYNLLTWLTIHNTSATDSYVNVKDGSTVIAVIPAPAKGGAVINFSPPLRSTANTAINVASGASVTSMHMYGGGYKAR